MAMLSFSTLAVHLGSPPEAIRLARVRGFQGVEILCEPPWHPRSWSPTLMRDVRAAAEGLALSLHAPTGDVNLISRHPGARQFAEAELSRTLALAARIGATHVTVHLGYRASGVPGEIPFDAAREALARLKRRADELGIVLCLENDPRLPYLYLWDLDRYLTWLEELDLMGTLDIGHAWTAHGEGTLELLPRLAPRIAVVHVSDNGGERDDHLPPGRGVIPLRGALASVKGAELWVLELMAPEGMDEARGFMAEILREG